LRSVGGLAEMVRTSSSLERLRLIGAVALTLGIVLIDVRQGEWSAFVRFLVAAVPCVALYVLALSIAKPGQPLERWQTATALCGLALLLLALIELADLLGASGDVSSGNGFWVTGLIALAAAGIAIRFHSPVHTLVAGLMLVVSILFFVDWVSDSLSLKTTRNVLIAFTVVYWAMAYGVRRKLPSLGRLHGDYLVLVGGFAAIVAGTIGAQSVGGAAFSFFSTSSSEGSTNGWELFLLSVSILLIYYTAWQGYRASAYLGLYGLISFLTVVGQSGGVGGWPLILLIAGLLALGFSLAGKQFSGSGGPAADPSPPPPPPPDTLP
jgi:hypothetical protein